MSMQCETPADHVEEDGQRDEDDHENRQLLIKYKEIKVVSCYFSACKLCLSCICSGGA